ncbi:MAG: low affinity iron permease family protein [Candidatus Limnocylindria bacterium]
MNGLNVSSQVAYGRLVDRVRDWLGHWVAPVIATLFIAAWLLGAPALGLPRQVVDLPLIISLLTLTLVFFSNRAEARDMAALQLKLDEVLTALEEAEGHTVGVERLDKSEVEALRARHEREGFIDPRAGE